MNRRALARLLAAGAAVIALAAACDSGSTASPTASNGGASPAATSAPSSALPPISPTDLGFRLDKNAFSFENYVNGPNITNLTAEDMNKVFGDAVCANKANGCELNPQSQAWMDAQNKAMGGGHCQGMSFLALAMYKGLAKPSDFGADSAAALKLDGNVKLQRAMAVAWVSQRMPLVRQGIVSGSPAEILDKLSASFASRDVLYGFAFFKRSEPFDGHATTPYAIVDKGAGKFVVQMYDNNFPGQVRELNIDKTANTWDYVGGPDPSNVDGKYEGDAQTQSLLLFPMEPHLQPQPCPFCDKQNGDTQPAAGSAGSSVGAANTPIPTKTVTFLLDGNPAGHSHIVITDAQGRRTGIAGGKVLREIPGSVVDMSLEGPATYQEDFEPQYTLPDGDYTVTLDAATLKTPDTESLAIIGPSYEVTLDKISMNPGKNEVLKIASAGEKVELTSGSAESPVIGLGASDQDADYSLDLATSGLAEGGRVTLNLASSLVVQSSSKVSFDLTMLREDDKGEATFKSAGISASSADIRYPAWKPGDKSMPATLDGAGKDLPNQA